MSNREVMELVDKLEKMGESDFWIATSNKLVYERLLEDEDMLNFNGYYPVLVPKGVLPKEDNIYFMKKERLLTIKKEYDIIV